MRPIYLPIIIFFTETLIAATDEVTPPLKVAKFDLLNKLSGKRKSIEIPIGSHLTIYDIRIEPSTCYKETDPFFGVTYRVPLTIYLEQGKSTFDPEEIEDFEDPIELYSAELNTNPRKKQTPIEHAIYDVILKECN